VNDQSASRERLNSIRQDDAASLLANGEAQSPAQLEKPGQSQALKEATGHGKRSGSASSLWSRNGQDGMVHESKRPARDSEARKGSGQESEHP
jgi:hypothetical protein